MNRATFILVIMVGYNALAIGFLKILWRLYGVHFYGDGIKHLPQATFAQDILLISLLFIFGLSLITCRAVLPALVVIISIYIIEFGLLHNGTHQSWHTIFAIASIGTQCFAIFLYAITFAAEQNTTHKQRP